VLPRGLAIRAGAASGIIPFGTTAEAWGAATALGAGKAGNACLTPNPRKHGLELSQEVKALTRAAVEAPEGGRASENGAQPRPRYQQAATFVDAARQWLACAFRRFASLISARDLVRKPDATFRDHALICA
jgi:hypothetical protein